MANVMITGGSGLVGWVTVDLLKRQGHEVVVFDVHPNPSNLSSLDSEAEVVPGDVTDLPRLLTVMKKHRIDHVVHLAALTAEHAASEPAAAFRINTLGTANVLEAAHALDVQRVVWTSSATVLAVSDDYDNELVPEEHGLISNQPYGASKFGAEIVADGFVRNHGLDVVGIRPALVYGLGRLGGGAGLFNEAIKRLALGQSARLVGTATLHQPLYNVDMAELLVSALFVGRPKHHLFNVPTLRTYTNDQLRAELIEIFPNADVAVVAPPAYVPKLPAIDGSRALHELGFKPSHSLGDGVRKLAEEFGRAAVDGVG